MARKDAKMNTKGRYVFFAIPLRLCEKQKIKLCQPQPNAATTP
jgi:hypothetical protein